MADNSLLVKKSGAPLGDYGSIPPTSDNISPEGHDCNRPFRDLGLIYRDDRFEVRQILGTECGAAQKCQIVVRGMSYKIKL